VVIEVVN